LDECHSLEEILVGFCTLEFDALAMVKHRCDFKLPKPQVSDASKIGWLRDIGLDMLRQKRDEIKKHIKGLPENDKMLPKIMRNHNYVATLHATAEKLLSFAQDEQLLVIHDSAERLIYKPLHCSGFANDIMFKWGDKTLLMSATVFGQETFTKSLDIKNFEWIDMPSTFPKENSPKILRPSGSMSYKNKQKSLPNLIKVVGNILDDHEGEKGIIHTVSYDVCEVICDKIGGKRLISPRGKDRDRQLREYMNDKDNDKVLISPSLNEGISLDGDLSRFAIICKVPYASLGDKWISARLKESQNWYNIKTTQSIVQMCGRSIRSEEDYAITYLIDSDFVDFFKRNHSLFPNWWLETLKVG
jgi:Rad3-related DNA helicase